MTEYSYGRQSRRTRDYEPEYVEETTYVSRGSGRPTTTEVVFRGRDDESVGEVTRYDAPSTYRRSYRDDYYPSTRARSERRRDDYYDDYYSDYGASAYSRRRRGDRDRGYRDDGYYSDYDDRSERRSEHRSERSGARSERRKSRTEEILEGVGLGGLVGTLRGKSREKGERRGSRSSSSGRSGRRSHSQEARKKWQQAAKAAVTAGVIQAIANRKEPGGWTGPKGQRALTAALGAAGIDGFLDRNPEEKSKRHIIESVLGGLVVNRVANGSASRSASGARGRSLSRGPSMERDSSVASTRSRTGLNLRARSRSIIDRARGRSSSRGADSRYSEYSPDTGPRQRSSSRGLKQVAGLAGVAAVGTAIWDRVRSKSRGRQRSRSASSDGSYVPTRRSQYQQSREIGPDSAQDTRVGRTRGRGGDEGSRSGGGEDREVGNRDRGGDGEGERKKRSSSSSSSSSVSTTDLENQRKGTHRKELLTAGLATVATIHAAHGVYSSMVASEKRHKLVAEGEMSQEEARKRKSKNMLQDAAAIGIAALGIKSAFSEWKEMNEHRHSVHELEERRRRHRKAREKREKEEERKRSMQQGNMYGLGGYPQGEYAPAYADGNPYAAGGGLPPPPVGMSQARY